MQPTRLPPLLESRPFSIADAAAQGVCAERLRRADLYVPARGVRTTTPPTSLLERARALHPILPPDAMFSHETGAGLLALPLPARLERQGSGTHVMTPTHHPAVRRAGVVGHRGAELRHRIRHLGLDLTSAVDIWLDLAPRLTVDELVQLGDAIVYREPDDLPRLHDLVKGSRGIRGIVRAREALALVRVGSASPRETWLRLHLARSGLPAPELNTDVFDAHGQWIANVDLLWREQRVVVEYDGEVHHDPAHRMHDAQRRRQLTSAGWRVVVLTRADVPGRMADVVADLRELLC